MRKAHIEAGVTGFVGELEAVSLAEILLGVSVMDSHQLGWFPKIFKAIQYIPSSSHGNQGTHPPDHGSVDGTPPRERESEDIASSGTGTGHNAGTFVASTKNTGDDPECPLSQLKPMKHRLSSD